MCVEELTERGRPNDINELSLNSPELMKGHCYNPHPKVKIVTPQSPREKGKQQNISEKTEETV